MIRLIEAGVVSGVVAAVVFGPSGWRPPRRDRSMRPLAGTVVGAVRRGEAWLPSLRRIGDHEIVAVLAATLLVGVVVPPLVLAAPILLGSEAVRRERRAATRRQRALTDALPEMIDQLALAVGAGLTLPVALRQVHRWLPDPIGGLVADTLARLDAGSALTDALAHLGRGLPESARRPLTVVIAATRDGAPLGPSLTRAADEARRARRRDAEIRARRLPVLMLLPLVLCVLPAFVLLTLVPLIVGSLDGLAITDGFPDP
ncbi:MAG: type II secretion system F family protein [Actinomycetota bacterium]